MKIKTELLLQILKNQLILLEHVWHTNTYPPGNGCYYAKQTTADLINRLETIARLEAGEKEQND